METVVEGKPIQIVVAKDDHTFELDEEALKSIVDRDGIRDKPIAVISVAGAFRKGKSFLLDFFIRYLYSKNSPDWLGPEDRPLRGFSWRGGCERETTGIQAWSQVFPVSTPHGEVNVLLLDTQGAFDSESTVKDCATIFALSTMTSSVQIYNLSGNIQEDDLQHLQLFTEYGRLALEDTGDKPFQKLMFLIRDWSFPYEAPYGLEGGEKILDRRLTVTEKQHEELRTLRKHIRSCFSAISCFLMPHPGLKVATNPHFDGRLSDIEADFKTELKELVPCVLSAENLVVKQIGGNYIRAQDLVYYFKAYMEVYKGDELPEPKSMLEATAEANNLSAVASARELYTNQMEAVCGGNQPYINTQRLEAEHERIFEQSMQHFYSRKKMGGEDFSVRFKERLERDIQEQFTQYKTHNEAKNVFKAARTPATLLAVAILAYLLSGILGLVGLYSIANLLNLCMGVTLLTLCTWAYVRYSGDMRDIGKQIDLIAEAIWESGGKKFLRPAYVTIMDAGLQQAAQQATNYTLGSSGVGSQNNGSASNGKLKTS